MNPAEIRAVAEAMRDCGIVYLKTHDLELSCRADSRTALAPVENLPTNPTQPGLPLTSGFAAFPIGTQQAAKNMNASTAPVQLSTEEENEIKHKVEAVESLMKMSDEALIDRLFPEPEAPKDSE